MKVDQQRQGCFSISVFGLGFVQMGGIYRSSVYEEADADMPSGRKNFVVDVG